MNIHDHPFSVPEEYYEDVKPEERHLYKGLIQEIENMRINLATVAVFLEGTLRTTCLSRHDSHNEIVRRQDAPNKLRRLVYDQIRDKFGPNAGGVFHDINFELDARNHFQMGSRKVG